MQSPSPVDAASRRVGRAVLLGMALAAVSFAAYHNSLSGGFVLDDLGSIVENPTIRRLWPPGPLLKPPETAGVGGRPLANVTFALNYAISGLDPWSYHAGNVLLHTLTALVLFAVIRTTLRRPGVTVQCQGRADVVALACAALWTAHPLTTAVVDYASQRTEGLMALLCVTTLYLAIRGADLPHEPRWPVLAAVCCGAGMAAKESIVTAPLLILLYDRAFLAGSFRNALRIRRGLYIGLAATWLIVPALALTSDLPARGVGIGLGITPLEYAAAQAVAVPHYLALAVWPHPLVFDHGWAYPSPLTNVAPRALLVVALVALSGWAAWRFPKAGFLPAAGLLLLAPTSSVVPIVQQPIAESRMYLPVAAVGTGLVVTLASTLGLRRALVAGVAILVAFVCLTVQRNSDYVTPVRLWSDTIAKRPESARAHGSLGAVLLASGELAAAENALRRAVQLRPSYADAHNNLGIALLRTDRPADAVGHFEAALRAQPGAADTHYNLSTAYHRLGRTAEAIRQLETAIRLSPRHARAHNNLSVLLLANADVAAAIRHAEAALESDPNFADAHYNLANALVRTGRTREAIDEYHAALRENPNFARAANNLGVLALRAGDRAAAIAHFETAVRIDPGYDEARQNLQRVTGSR